MLLVEKKEIQGFLGSEEGITRAEFMYKGVQSDLISDLLHYL
jgi:hypothetical protein